VKLRHDPAADPIDRLVPPVVSYLVSPEKRIRAVRTPNQGVPADPSTHAFRISRRKAGAAGGSSRSQLTARSQPSLHFARTKSSRINTSVKSSFFMKSLITNDLKSNRISTGDNKPRRINTSENYHSKPFRINTSKKHPGGGGGCARPNMTPATTKRHARPSRPSPHAASTPHPERTINQPRRGGTAWPRAEALGTQRKCRQVPEGRHKP